MYYIGSTQNLSLRIKRHNSRSEPFTSKGAPWILVWSATKPSRKEAFALERKIKNLKSKYRIKQFIHKYS